MTRTALVMLFFVCGIVGCGGAQGGGGSDAGSAGDDGDGGQWKRIRVTRPPRTHPAPDAAHPLAPPGRNPYTRTKGEAR